MTGTLKNVQGNAIAGAKSAAEEGKRVVVPHVCNDIGKWGSGFVVALNNALGLGPREAYTTWHANEALEGNDFVKVIEPLHDQYDIRTATMGRFALGGVQLVKHIESDISVANMIAQHQVRGMDETGRPPIRYGALGKSMRQLATMMSASVVLPEMHCPMFGSDLAGGDWKIIAELIQECWVDRGFDVTIYEFV